MMNTPIIGAYYRIDCDSQTWWLVKVKRVGSGIPDDYVECEVIDSSHGYNSIQKFLSPVYAIGTWTFIPFKEVVTFRLEN